jgi:hypothetical protein
MLRRVDWRALRSKQRDASKPVQLELFERRAVPLVTKDY